MQNRAPQFLLVHSYGFNTNVANQPPININTATTVASQMGEFLLESTNVYWASNGATGFINAMGWEDNI